MPQRQGGTYLSLLLVLGALLLLGSLFFPKIAGVREAARKSQCHDNLHNLSIALRSYDVAHNVLPPGWVRQDPWPAQWGWGAQVLPFLESNPTYDLIDVGRGPSLAESASVPSHLAAMQRGYHLATCPTDEPPFVNASRPVLMTTNTAVLIRTASYVGVHGIQWTGFDPPTGCFGENSSVRLLEISDGASQTLLLGERGNRFGESVCDAGLFYGVSKAAPTDIGFREHDVLGIAAARINTSASLAGRTLCRDGFSSQHAGGMQAAMVDATVRFISERTDPAVLNTLCGRDDGVPTGRW